MSSAKPIPKRASKKKQATKKTTSSQGKASKLSDEYVHASDSDSDDHISNSSKRTAAVPVAKPKNTSTPPVRVDGARKVKSPPPQVSGSEEESGEESESENSSSNEDESESNSSSEDQSESENDSPSKDKRKSDSSSKSKSSATKISPSNPIVKPTNHGVNKSKHASESNKDTHNKSKSNERTAKGNGANGLEEASPEKTPRFHRDPIQYAAKVVPASTYHPPNKFTPVQVSSESAPMSNILESNLSEKQIWHISLPADVSPTLLMGMDLEKALSGQVVINHKGVDYTSKVSDNSTKLLLTCNEPDPSYAILSKGVDADLRLRQAVDTPISSTVIRPVKRKHHHQPNGLRVRFNVFGFDIHNENVGFDDEDDSEMEMPEASVPTFKLPQGVDQVDRPKKRKHEIVNDDAEAIPKKKAHTKNNESKHTKENLEDKSSVVTPVKASKRENSNLSGDKRRQKERAEVQTDDAMDIDKEEASQKSARKQEKNRSEKKVTHKDVKTSGELFARKGEKSKTPKKHKKGRDVYEVDDST